MSMGLSAGQRDALAVDIRKSQTIKPSTYFQHAVLPQNAPIAHLSDKRLRGKPEQGLKPYSDAGMRHPQTS